MHLPRLARPIHRTDAGAFTAGVRPSAIEFTAGWDSAANSDVHAYTQLQARAELERYSDDLRATINSPRCTVRVNKGCHQVGDPHFTIDERARNCGNAVYAGTRNLHVPC